MKKILIVTTICTAIIGSAIGVYAAGMRCSSCNGSGFKGNFNCTMCKGTGRSSDY
jgi:DnaJ-class molecular chaperone